MAMTADSESSAWSKLTGALGIQGAVVGERCETSGDAPRLGGIVEGVGGDGKHELLIRTDVPAPGLAQFLATGCAEMGPGMTLVLARLFLYGDGAEAAMAGTAESWASWMAGHFPPPAPPAEQQE